MNVSRFNDFPFIMLRKDVKFTHTLCDSKNIVFEFAYAIFLFTAYGFSIVLLVAFNGEEILNLFEL